MCQMTASSRSRCVGDHDRPNLPPVLGAGAHARGWVDYDRRPRSPPLVGSRRVIETRGSDMAMDARELDERQRETWRRGAQGWERRQGSLREKTAPVAQWLVEA